MQPFSTLPDWVTLEHDVARILTEQELHGWHFDIGSARELEFALRAELRELTQVLQDRFPYVPGIEFTPKRNNKTQGYIQGCSFTKLKDFNPSSRDHIAWILTTHDGWTPEVMTNTGKPMVDETTLKNHGTGLSLQFFRILEITKTLGMISEGVNAWLKLVTSSSRVHHHCSVGAATHRCAHRNPNLAQVPSGPEYRKLFLPSPGMVMVGADLSGIELRMLGHYLARYDGGEYIDELLNGDIHQKNADKIGITRKLVKNVTYAFLYGAGDEKIGHTYDKQLCSSKAKRKGKEIKQAYVDAIPGLDKLLAAIKEAADRGFVRAIDDRKIILDSPHKALNFLLQSGAGVVAKRWMVINYDAVDLNKCAQLAFIHDELQFESDKDYTEALSTSLVQSAAEAGTYYELRCPIAAEAKTGANWAEVH
jgi:DNA polymerase I-like protein with 3'-5' exonuclease and polymerase domains